MFILYSLISPVVCLASIVMSNITMATIVTMLSQKRQKALEQESLHPYLHQREAKFELGETDKGTGLHLSGAAFRCNNSINIDPVISTTTGTTTIILPAIGTNHTTIGTSFHV